MSRIPSTLFMAIAAVGLVACPGPDADREELEERPEVAEEPVAEPAPAWSAEFAGAVTGTFQGEIATPETANGRLALRLSSEAQPDEPQVLMMIELAGLEEGQTGEVDAQNATVMVGADAYFHAADQPTHLTVDIQEHRDGRLVGSFSGSLQPDGPGEGLGVDGSFEALNRPDPAARTPRDRAPGPPDRAPEQDRP